MALRTKTVDFPIGFSTAALAAATRLDFASQTLYIPENTSRTFRSVIVEITCRGTETAATSMTSWLIGVQLAAVAVSDVTVTDTITNSGEQQTFVFTRDVTDYFNTNFGSGTSQTCVVAAQFGGLGTINIGAKLIVTYEWDDASQPTRVKTVKIPLESPTGNLTATLAEIGTNQVPNLDTFLPEASKTYRYVWFEIVANENTTGVTDAQLGVRLDAEAEVLDGLHENGLQSACWYKRIWVRNDMTTNATHAFAARVTSTQMAMSNLAVVLCVTYEYNHSTSTAVMNSLQVPLGKSGGFMASTAAGDSERLRAQVWVEEPATIALAQSGVLLGYNENAGFTLNVRAGGQAYRAYTVSLGSVTCGMGTLLHRIDAGAAQGAGATLARGLNVIDLDAYVTTAAGSCLTGLLLLNYTSGIDADGDAVHNHTTVWSKFSTVADAVRHVSAAGGTAPNRTPAIPEASYFVNSVGYALHFITTAAATCAIALATEVVSGEVENQGDGWCSTWNSLFRSDAENGVTISHVRAADFNRYPGDPKDLLDIEANRLYRLDFSTASWAGFYQYVTYHAITFAVTGTVTGYNGDGSGIVIAFFRSDTNEHVGTATTTTGGNYSFTWYDNTITVYGAARQSSTRAGRTDNLTPA